MKNKKNEKKVELNKTISKVRFTNLCQRHHHRSSGRIFLRVVLLHLLQCLKIILLFSFSPFASSHFHHLYAEMCRVRHLSTAAKASQQQSKKANVKIERENQMPILCGV